MTYPLVSVIVPAWNEADDMEACLMAIAAQDYPVNLLEVIVVDGCSTDGTHEVARGTLGRLGFGSTAVVLNEGRTASSNLNVGLARASGEIICRVDARTRIQTHYVRTCVETLATRPEVEVVGGAQIAIARSPTARAIGIARALNNRWSMGGSRYRRAMVSGPSDTVYLGAFRRRSLVRDGGWDEHLVSNQDFDLNRRMAAHGTVWFDASLRSGYVPRATLRQVWQQYRRFGRAKVRYWRWRGSRPEKRHVALLAAPTIAILLAMVLLIVASVSQVLVVIMAALAAAAGIEVRGAPEPSGGPIAHVVGVWTMAVVTVGWVSGVWHEVLSPRAGASR